VFFVLLLSKKTPKLQTSKQLSDPGELPLKFPQFAVSSARTHLSAEYRILFPAGHAGHQGNKLPGQEPYLSALSSAAGSAFTEMACELQTTDTKNVRQHL